MNCPHCASGTTKEQTKKTALGYRTFRCSACKQTFNERTGTLFNFLEYPTDVVLLVVRNYLHPHKAVGEPTPHSEQRQVFLDRLAVLKTSIQASSW